MATDLNQALNLEQALQNLDAFIKKVEELNSTLGEFLKTIEDTAKATDTLNKAQEQSEDIVKNTAKATDQLNNQEEELTKIKTQAAKTAEQLNVVNSKENVQLIKNRVALQQANKEIRDRIKAEETSIKSTEKANKIIEESAKSIGEAQRQNKSLRAAIKEVDVTTDAGRKTIEKFNAKIEENDELITQNSDSFIQQKRNIGNYQSALEGLDGAFGGVISSTKALLANPVVLTITAITTAFSALVNALDGTTEGQKILATATGFLNGLLDGLSEIVIALVDPLVRLFEDPQKALEDFQQAIKDRIFTIFDSLKNIALGVGQILTGIWERDLDKITQGAADAGKAFFEFQKASNPLVAIVTTIAEKTEETLGYAKGLAGIEAERFELEKQRVKFTITEAQTKREIADLVLKSKNEELDALERQNAIREAEQLTAELTAQRIADKEEQLRLLRAEGDLGSENLDYLKEEAALVAEIIGLEENRANQLRSLGNRRRTLQSEIEREREAEQKLFDEQQERFAIRKQQQEEESKKRLETRELKKIEADEDRERLIAAANTEIELNEALQASKENSLKTVSDATADAIGEQFGISKGAALKEAAINVSQGVTKAIAQGGIAGIATGALVAAAGAVQIANIAGINLFAKGTKNAPKGLAIVSERGAEIIEDENGLRLVPDMSLVNLKGGEKIHTAAETRQMLFNDKGIIKAIKDSKQKIVVNIPNSANYSDKYRFRA